MKVASVWDFHARPHTHLSFDPLIRIFVVLNYRTNQIGSQGPENFAVILAQNISSDSAILNNGSIFHVFISYLRLPIFAC